MQSNDLAEALLAKAAHLQTEFWDCLRELEAELDIEIESTTDLNGMTVDDLREAAEEN